MRTRLQMRYGKGGSGTGLRQDVVRLSVVSVDRGLLGPGRGLGAISERGREGTVV
jgi:hypothetical protein